MHVIHSIQSVEHEDEEINNKLFKAWPDSGSGGTKWQKKATIRKQAPQQ